MVDKPEEGAVCFLQGLLQGHCIMPRSAARQNLDFLGRVKKQ